MNSAYSLKRYPFFANLEDKFLEKIYEIAEIREVKEGDWVFKQEQDATHIYLIQEGKIAFTISIRDHIIDRINPYMRGEIIGWSALVKPYIYTLGAVAEADSKLIGFDGKALLALMEEDRCQGYTLLKNLTEVMGERLINFNLQLLSLRS